MIPKKFIIHFIGHSCSGKTTLEKTLAKELPRTYLVSYDKVKWQLFNYSRDTDSHFIKQIIEGFFEVICKTGIPILLMAPLDTEEKFSTYKQIADTYGYTMMSIELTAPREVLLTRFRERLESVKIKGGKLSLDNEFDYIKRLSRSFFIPANTLSFDTSLITPEIISHTILERLKKLS